MAEDEDIDNLERATPIPKHIDSESSYRTIVPAKAQVFDEDSDTDDFGNADTDRIDVSRENLGPHRVSPSTLTIRLLRIASTFAPCFFCGGSDCDLTFVAKSHSPGKTKAYASHSECVFDHEELQALGSGGL